MLSAAPAICNTLTRFSPAIGSSDHAPATMPRRPKNGNRAAARPYLRSLLLRRLRRPRLLALANVARFTAGRGWPARRHHVGWRLASNAQTQRRRIRVPVCRRWYAASRVPLRRLQGGDGIGCLLPRLGEIADLAPERLHLPTQAIELVVRPFAARAAWRRHHRLQLQPQDRKSTRLN